MKKQIELSIYPDKLTDRDLHKKLAAQKLRVHIKDITVLIPLRRSIDARKTPVYKILYDVYVNEKPVFSEETINYLPVKGDRKVIITGFGPGGMFAALWLRSFQGRCFPYQCIPCFRMKT